MVGQGMLALPGMGALTAGGKSASKGGIYVPATAPSTPLAPASSVTNQSTVAGDTFHVYGATARDIEELQYRQSARADRTLAALSGEAP